MQGARRGLSQVALLSAAGPPCPSRCGGPWEPSAAVLLGSTVPLHPRVVLFNENKKPPVNITTVAFFSVFVHMYTRTAVEHQQACTGVSWSSLFTSGSHKHIAGTFENWVFRPQSSSERTTRTSPVLKQTVLGVSLPTAIS